MNLTLVSVIVILTVCAIIGIKRGLLKMLAPLIFGLVSVVVMVFLTPEITKYISDKTDWDENIQAATEEFFEDRGLLLDGDSLKEADIISPILLDNIDENFLDSGFGSYNEYIINKASDTIFSAIVMVGIFLTMLLIFVLIQIIINAAGKMPVIRCVNRFAGMLAGLMLGLIITELFFVILMVFHNTEWAVNIYRDISDSVFLSLLYDNNLLLITIVKIF